MTSVRYWDSEVAVVCPFCNREAMFDAQPYEFIPEREWKKSGRTEPNFKFSGWRVVERYPSLVRWSPQKAVNDTKQRKKHGVIKCSNCSNIREGYLAWPEDAYYKWDIRGKLLWANNRRHAVALMQHIESNHRGRGRGFGFYKLPSIITSRKNRNLVAKKILQSLR